MIPSSAVICSSLSFTLILLVIAIRFDGISEAVTAPDYFCVVHWSTQSLTVLYQRREFWGFWTKWLSSGIELRYADGSTWHARSGAECRVTPDGVMLIADK